MTDFPPVPSLKPWAIERMERNWPPTVEVAQCGRWSYLVSLVHGPHAESTGVLGRSRAERKARRVLTAYVAQCERERGWAFDAKTIGVER